jgi:hypothetical protein
MDRITKLSRSLENHFFYEENLMLKKELSRLRLEEQSIGALSNASGIVNAEVLKELVNRNIRPETLAAMALVPIIEVAWADGTISEPERKAVLYAANSHGFSESNLILHEWLSNKPTPPLFDTWRKYMEGLCEIITPETIIALKEELIKNTKMVAKASGGFLSLIDPVSPEEKVVINSIESFFNQPGPCKI